MELMLTYSNSNVITNDIIFNHNDVEYMRFKASDDELQLSKKILN